MIDGKELEEVVRISTALSFGMVKELLESETKYMSRKEATKKYKGLLPTWEAMKLVRAIPTHNGKHEVFPQHRLVELYEIWVRGGSYIAEANTLKTQ